METQYKRKYVGREYYIRGSNERLIECLFQFEPHETVYPIILLHSLYKYSNSNCLRERCIRIDISFIKR